MLNPLRYEPMKSGEPLFVFQTSEPMAAFGWSDAFAENCALDGGRVRVVDLRKPALVVRYMGCSVTGREWAEAARFTPGGGWSPVEPGAQARPRRRLGYWGCIQSCERREADGRK